MSRSTRWSRAWRAVAAALAVTAALGTVVRPALAASAESVPAPATSSDARVRATVTLVVTVDLGADDGEIRKVVRESVQAALMSERVAVEEDSAAVFIVEIRWREGSTTDFAIAFRLGRDLSSLPDPIHAFRCDGCSASQLLARVAEEARAVVPPVLAADARRRAEPKEPTPPEAARRVEPPKPRVTPEPRPPRRRIDQDTLYWIGLSGVLSGSAALLGSFGVLMARTAIGDEPRPVEWWLLSTGSIAVGGGIVYGVWRKRERERRRSAWVHPTARGLALSGRF